VRTHYDNLKIAEGAPDEVVKAAYRALSQRYHPDKNPGNKDAGRIMQILNDAYETLSDPVRRRQYDALVAQARQRAATSSTPPPVPRQSPPQPHPAPAYQRRRRSFWSVVSLVLFWDFRLTLLAIIFAGAGIASLFEKKRPRQPYTPNPPPSASGYAPTTHRAPRPAFIRPTTAPNGQPWPAYAAYIPGYQVLAGGGLSSVTVDNTRNSSDVFLKLVSLNSAEAYPVRLCYIPARSQFKFQNVAAGRYDVRYRDLSSGGYSKTEEFTLNETRTYQGTKFSDLSLTLYKVSNGNMHTESIDASEF
jgi:DnaJ domain